MTVVACSTSKNTGASRFYHATTARFNTLYNGRVAFDEGIDAQIRGHKDDYTSLLPMYYVADKQTASIGKSNFETAITKSEKAIKKHSIKRKPKKPLGRMTAKEKAFYMRNEFNPYIHNAWMMLADAQFQTGDFIEAAATYNYIVRLYGQQPEVSSVARAKLARCYVLLEWPYDAEDILNKLRRDSIPPKGQREFDASRAAYFISTEQYAEAIPLLEASIRHAKPRMQRARLYYLLGQLNARVGKKDAAYKAFGKCVRMNPPYELAFNARIMQTEVTAQGKGRAMIRKLQRMAKNPNNADYLDRIYYAIGNIHLASRDTMRTIYAWEKGIEESTLNGYAKAVVLQHLGELQWERGDYIKAAPCYAELATLMKKEKPEYREVERRSKALAQTEPHLSAVKLQDSLQVLAKLPEKEYLAVIDRVIAELKKKEREAEKKAALRGGAGAAATTTTTAAASRPRTATPATTTAASRRGGQTTTFYFYNAQTVSQGKQEFQRRWGQRPNEDNWRRSTKARPDDTSAPGDMDMAAADSLGLGSDGLSEEEQARLDSLANDPHEREYYIRQLPLTEEQLEASNKQIEDGLYKGGVALMEHIEDFDRAERMLLRLVNDFPETASLDDVYYHLFLLAMRRGDAGDTERYRQLLQANFADSELTRTISHPRFIELAQNGKHLEDSLYAATYTAYKEERYHEVDANYAVDTTDFNGGQHAAKFLFIHAMTQLYTNHRERFFQELKTLTEKYSADEISAMAQYIVKGITEGRLLVSDKWDASSIWDTRSLEAAADSTATDTLAAEPEVPFVFVLAYPAGEVDENQLIYEMAAYNFLTFQARNFDIETVQAGVISQLRISGFKNYDEVHLYAQQLHADARMRQLLEGIRVVLISEENLKLLGTKFSYEDYTEFYDEKLSGIQLPEQLILDEPTDLPVVDPEDVPPPSENSDTDGGNDDDTDDNGGNDDEDWLW